MIACLSLFDRWIKRNDKEHLPAIFVGQQEEPKDRGHGDFVVKSFTVELEKRLEYFDVVTTAEKRKIDHEFKNSSQVKKCSNNIDNIEL